MERKICLSARMLQSWPKVRKNLKQIFSHNLDTDNQRLALILDNTDTDKRTSKTHKYPQSTLRHPCPRVTFSKKNHEFFRVRIPNRVKKEEGRRRMTRITERGADIIHLFHKEQKKSRKNSQNSFLEIFTSPEWQKNSYSYLCSLGLLCSRCFFFFSVLCNTAWGFFCSCKDCLQLYDVLGCSMCFCNY